MDTIQVILPGNIKITAPNDLRQISPFVLVERNDWFEDEIHFVRSYLKAGMNVLDIGANLGCYTLTMAKLVGAQGRVYSFEPNALAQSHIRESISVNQFPNISLYDYALSNFDGSAHYADGGNPELGQIQRDAPDEHNVVVKRLASIQSLRDVSFDFIKLDAEGEEVKIIEGGRAIFELQSPIILVEIKHGAIYNEQLFDVLVQMGYRFYRYIRPLDALVPVDDMKKLDRFVLNLIACKASEETRLLQHRGYLINKVSNLDLSVMGWESRKIRELFARFPYSADLIDSWMNNIESVIGINRNEYLQALLFFNQYQNESLSKSERYAYLQAAYDLMCELSRDSITMSRLISFARVAFEIGCRHQGINRLTTLIMELDKRDGTFSIPEPLIPACARYDYIDPKGRIREWLLSGITEQLLVSGSYSSYYTPEDSVEQVKVLATLGFFDLDMAVRGLLSSLRVHGIHNLSPELLAANDLLVSRVDDLRDIPHVAYTSQPMFA